MDRRSFLIGAVTSGLGFAAWQYRDEVTSATDLSLGPPDTDTPIKEIRTNGFLTDFVLYESGAARFKFGSDYGCHERIAVGDNSNVRANNLRSWQLPGNGTLVVDMQDAVSNTRDPSNKFYVESLAAKGNACFGSNAISVSFTVPADWIN